MDDQDTEKTDVSQLEKIQHFSFMKLSEDLKDKSIYFLYFWTKDIYVEWWFKIQSKIETDYTSRILYLIHINTIYLLETSLQPFLAVTPEVETSKLSLLSKY